MNSAGRQDSVRDVQKHREEGGVEGTPEGQCFRGTRQRDWSPGAPCLGTSRV